jgi:anti-sigma factor RsiW
MTCDQLLERAADLVDGDATAAVQADADAHLRDCPSCRAVVADLRRIRHTARALDRRVPPPLLFERIARQIDAEAGGAQGRPARRHLGPPVVPGWAWLAAAAVLVMAVGSGLWMMSRSWNPAAPPAAATDTAAAAADPVVSLERELQLAAAHYEKAVAALEQVANQSDSPLDPELTATLRKNIQVIDQAIDESRVALRAEPSNPLAQESLFDAFRRKISLLQDTIALMNEMRKGNEAGAARIVDGLNKS